MNLNKDWEFNVLQVYNYKLSGKLEGYFDFIRKNHNKLDGDICEVGVYRGFSILATALLLKELGSDKKVWGFDSFTGFPSYHSNDDLKKFVNLYDEGAITEQHFKDTQLNIQLKEFMSESPVSASNISTSTDFSETSLSLLERKISHLELDNIILVDGDYKDTMTQKTHTNVKFMSALIDCDLYESHKISLPFVWDRMPIGGYMFLDEYYSLKFPGARIATNEFFSDKLDKPEMYPRKPMDFERWFVKKNSE
jgi:hypothetical protein